MQGMYNLQQLVPSMTFRCVTDTGDHCRAKKAEHEAVDKAAAALKTQVTRAERAIDTQATQEKVEKLVRPGRILLENTARHNNLSSATRQPA